MKDCPFCDYRGPSSVLLDYEHAYVIEPLNRVTDGHLLVVSHKHVRDALEDPETTGRVMAVAAAVARAEQHKGRSDYNILTSVGEAATQTVFHLHVHLVPRVPGDGLALPWKTGTHQPDYLAQEDLAELRKGERIVNGRSTFVVISSPGDASHPEIVSELDAWLPESRHRWFRDRRRR